MAISRTFQRIGAFAGMLVAAMLAACSSSPPAKVWSISGTVSGGVIEAVPIELYKVDVPVPLMATVTDSAGRYTFKGVPYGDYQVAPQPQSSSWEPSMLWVNVRGSDVVGLDFTWVGPRPVYIEACVSGVIWSDVTVTLWGPATGTCITDGANWVPGTGCCSFLVPFGTYTFTAARPGFVLSPPSCAVVVEPAVGVGACYFVASPAPLVLSGTVSGAWQGLVVELGGAHSALTVTDSAGSYYFGGLGDGDYTVTPWVLSDTTFEPMTRRVSMVGTDIVSQDFTASVSPASSAWRHTDVPPLANWSLSGWSSSPNDAWAVSDYPHVLHWNGSSWSDVSGPGYYLRKVWGLSASDVWAVGGNSQCDYRLGCYLAVATIHWDGATWSSLPLTNVGADVLYGVWGSSSTDVWAVGTSTILHWDGTAWSMAMQPEADLRAVWGTSSSDVWAVGTGGTILHWDGTAWSNMPSGTTEHLYAIWGSAANDIWAVGQTILHWDGLSWTRSLPDTEPGRDLFTGRSSLGDAGFHAVWGSATNDVWAVGTYYLHWNGTSWSVIQGPNQMGFDLWGSSASDIWTTGEGGIFQYVGP